MPTSTKLLFMSGSAREASFNKTLARLGAEIAHANGLAATFADLGDYPMPIYDGDHEQTSGVPDNARKLEALMSVHAGVFIASPEYNASISPLVKNALDWVSRVKSDERVPLAVYKTRVFAVGSASPGGFGGMRGLIALRQMLVLGLSAVVLPDQIVVSRAGDAFDEQGHLKDKGQMEAFKALIRKLESAAKSVVA